MRLAQLFKSLCRVVDRVVRGILGIPRAAVEWLCELWDIVTLGRLRWGWSI